MKDYSSPRLIRFGDVADITGVFGGGGGDDAFIDHTGADISDGYDPGAPGGSIDSCATTNLSDCYIE
jgi:hypothetical protein